jgi:hypothetical protein
MWPTPRAPWSSRGRNAVAVDRSCTRRTATSTRPSASTSPRGPPPGSRNGWRSTPRATTPSASRWSTPSRRRCASAISPRPSRTSAAWDHLWAACDIEVPKDDRVQTIVRLHINPCPPMLLAQHRGPRRRRAGARPQRRGYRGHIFWDELYIFPFLNFAICRR